MASKYGKVTPPAEEQRVSSSGSKGYPPDLNRGGGFSRDFIEVRDNDRDFTGFRPTGSTMMQGFVSYDEELQMVSVRPTDTGVVGLSGSPEKDVAPASSRNYLLLAIAGAVIFFF